MKLIPDARRIFWRAWSSRCFYAIALVEAAQAILPYFELEISRTTMVLFIIGLALLGAFLRLVDQGLADEE